MHEPDSDREKPVAGSISTTQTLVLRHREETLHSKDGLRLVLQTWRPREVRAAILFVHGLAEHSGRYGYPVDFFTREGFLCAALDLRGHGRSEGRRVHVETFADYVDDVRRARDHLLQQEPDLTWFQVGHSMGGLITILGMLEDPPGIRAAAVSSPALGVPPEQEPGLFLSWLIRILDRIAPKTLLPGIESEAISRLPAVVEDYRRDPLVSKKVSPRFITAIRAAMEDANARVGDLKKELLVMQSAEDQLVDPAATERWAQAAPSDLVTWKKWDELYHEMFNEPERDEVFRYLLAWLEARLEAPTSTTQ